MVRYAMLMALGLLAGCQTTDGFYYEISTGQRADASPDLLTRLERAKTVCEGEASAARLQSLQGSVVTYELAQRVFRGCMIGQGFEVKA